MNGWHWSATNVFEQAKQILEELIADEATNPELAPGCRISKVDKFTGDVHTNMRKGKCKLTYDLNIHFKWVSNPPEEEEAVDDHFSGAYNSSAEIVRPSAGLSCVLIAAAGPPLTVRWFRRHQIC